MKITLHLLANKTIVWQIYEKQLKRDLFKVIVEQVYNDVEKDIKMFSYFIYFYHNPWTKCSHVET